MQIGIQGQSDLEKNSTMIAILIRFLINVRYYIDLTIDPTVAKKCFVTIKQARENSIFLEFAVLRFDDLNFQGILR